MKCSGLFFAIAVLLVVNAVVLGGVAYNRQGEPDTAVLLSERELPLAYNYQRHENSGVALKLNWQHHEQALDWFDADKLAELGMDSDLPAPGEDSYYYRRSLPIKAYVVLEFAGDAWARYQADKHSEIADLPNQVAQGRMEPDAAERREKELHAALRLASRLFAIDAGADPQQLRNRYPDRARYLILLAKVRSVVTWEKSTPRDRDNRRLQGQIDSILTDSIHVPKQYHAFFAELPNGERIYPGGYYYSEESKQRAHYQVGLHYGRRHEPWIFSIAPL